MVAEKMLQGKIIDQVGIVVTDLQKAIDYYSSVLGIGIGLFKVFSINAPNHIVRGQINPLKMKCAFAQIGALQIELIQSIEGENIYTEFLEAKGEGLHHLGIRVDDVDKEVVKLEEKGISVLQRGSYSGISWAYMDTADIGGVIFELIPKLRR